MVSVTIYDTTTLTTVSLYPEAPLPLSVDAGEDFDNGELICKHLSREEPFVEGDEITITVDSKVFYFIVDSDEVNALGSHYNHIINVVEDTAKLSKYIGANRYFTKTSTGGVVEYIDHLNTFFNTVPSKC